MVGVVGAHTFNSRTLIHLYTWMAEAGGFCEFRASLVYTIISKTVTGT